MLHIRDWTDAIHARQRGRELAAKLGFGLVDQTIVAYTISELALKLIQFPEKGHMVIRKLQRSKEESDTGIEVRMYEHYRGKSRLNSFWAEQLVDDLELILDPSRGNVVLFRKWRLGPLRVGSPIYAAGEE